MDPDNQPSIQMIADKVGLSKATVSRVLRNVPGHKAETRDKIMKVAKELGYSSHPIMSAVMSSVRFKKTAQFSPIIAEIHCQPWGRKRAWNMEVLRKHVHKQAHNLGYRIEEFSWFNPEMKPQRLMDIIRARGIRGVILEHFMDSNMDLEVDVSDLAMVSIGGGLRSPQLHKIEVNYFGGLLMAFKKLRAYGYRRLGVALPRFFETMSEFKREGALHIAHQDMDPDARIPIFHMDDDEPFTGLKPWLDRYNPDCVLGVGRSLEKELKRLGYKFPKDMGFAHLGWHPAYEDLAGVNPSWGTIGETAVNQVVEQLNRNAYGVPEHPLRILIDGTWVDGKSVNIPANSGTFNGIL
jgi:LacI family transcriptional regulator